jgi:hypothetical protein
MALPINRTPVEDTVPKVNQEFAVGEDVEFANGRSASRQPENSSSLYRSLFKAGAKS